MAGLEIAIAAITLIVSTAISEVQMSNADNRASRETYIRHLYQAVRNRFGVSQDQLSQLSNKLDINLSQLSEATRGSARLSTASAKLRSFIKKYPQLINGINKAKNILSGVMNNLQAEEDATASRIQSRNQVSNQEILTNLTEQVRKGNEAIRDVNKEVGSDDVNDIDTSLHVQQPTGSTRLSDSINSYNSAMNTGLTLRH